MIRQTVTAAVFSLSLTLFLSPLAASAQRDPLSAEQRAEIEQFRQRQEQQLRSPSSALGMVALNKLQEGDTSIGSAADNTVVLRHAAPHLGIVRVRGEEVEFVPNGAFPADLRVGGRPAAAGAVHFDADGTSPKFEEGSVNFVLRHKFGFFLVGRDTRAPELLAFHGLSWYPPDARFRIVAQWKPWPQPRVLRIANILGQVNEETSYGVAEFTRDGVPVRMEPSVYPDRTKPLFFVFRDATSRATTYPGGRFLDAGMPDHGLSQPGTVVLDFNQARNPLCAFSAHTSCPLPPAGNRLPFRIPAGEKRYYAEGPPAEMAPAR